MDLTPAPEDAAVFAQQKAQANAAAAAQASMQGAVTSLTPLATSSTGFLGMNMNDACPAGFCYHTPDGALAVGPTSMLEVVNQAWAVYDRSGNRLLGPVKLAGFFGTSNPPYDVRTLYDAGNGSGGGYGGGSGRFVMMSLTKGKSSSDYWIAVSQNNSPQTGGTVWCRYQLDARTRYGGSTAAADYPGMGMDGNNIYITSNQLVFGSGLFQGARVLVIPKSSIYPNTSSGSCPKATSTDFPHLLNPDGYKTYTVQPANEPDAVPGQTSPPMFFVNSRGSGSSQIIVRSMGSGPTLYAPYAVNVAKYDTPANAPQLNGQAIYTGDVTLLGAVYRYGTIYTANNTRTVSNGSTANPYSSAQWYELTPGSSTGVSHTITNASVAFYMPQVIVGCSTTSVPCPTPFVALEFTGSGRSQPASAYRMLAGGTAALLHSGVGGWTYTGSWGDFPGVSTDPNDSTRVWLEGEYVKTPTSWGTAIGSTCSTC
ncbi:MAG: hypothetical protein DLM70_07880 [Chloroflexi bacterium]|nr:MAG: hypothetical protein DLM70_07880 [Chloroflexota bacterium]